MLIAVSLGGVAIWQYWRSSVANLDARITRALDLLAGEVTNEESVLHVEVPMALRTALSEDDSYYGVYDAEGHAIDGDAPPLDPDDAVRSGTLTLGDFREQRRVGPLGSMLRIGRPLAPLRASLFQLVVSLLVAAVFTLLLAVPLTFWLRRALQRSLFELDRTARRLAPGRPARIDLTGVDIELVGVARRLNEAFDRLEAALHREQQLTADASHELRTPVSVILAEAEWGLDRPRTADEYRHSLEVCRRQGRRLKALTESLLALTRIETDGATHTREPVELAPLVDSALNDLQRSADARRITLARHGEATAVGDPVHLGILIANLVTNAVRYNHDNGRVDVHIAAGEDGFVQLDVDDTGIGIPADAHTRVFRRFWRADEARGTGEGGVGLGLAISKAIVMAHGGTITCTPREGGGTRFSVRLPGA